MKNTIWIMIIALLLGCGNNYREQEMPSFQEHELSFLHLRFGYEKTNNWIKKPNNLLMLHETFKAIGYEKLITEEEWKTNGISYLNVWKRPISLIDSLEITFSNYENSSKYYREFWERRKREGNIEVVYQIVKEVKQIMFKTAQINSNNEMVNDTLMQLLSFEYPLRELKKKEADKQLNYLIKIGLHQSAYNVLFGENSRYAHINWNSSIKEKMQLLNRTELRQNAWFEDDTP